MSALPDLLGPRGARLARRAARTVRAGRATARNRASQARTCAERYSLARRLPTPIPAPSSRILCYHSVGTPSWGVNDVRPALFARQVEQILEAGFEIVPATALADATHTDRRLALTFDDGLTSVLTHAAPALADLGVPWTVFVVSDWAEGRHEVGDLLLDWAGVERLAEHGATLASHSATHPNFATLGEGETADELGRSREALRSRLGIDTTEFAIPFGQSGNWSPAAQRAALDAGYRTIYAQSVDRRPAGTVPRTFVTRFDTDRIFRAALAGAFDEWEEWT